MTERFVAALHALWQYRDELLVLVLGVIGAVSVLLKAVDAFLVGLCKVFPGLAPVEGRVHWIVAILDALFVSNKLLNRVAFNRSLKALLLPLLVASFLASAPVHAQVLVSSGPTIPLMMVRPGNPHPVSLAAGAGYQLSFTTPAFQRALGGRAWDLFDLNLMAFGSAVSGSSGQTFGAFSAAVGVCTLSTLFCIGAGHDVATSPGMAPGWFGLFALSFNFAGAPETPPVGMAEGAHGLVRGNHLYFGGL